MDQPDFELYFERLQSAISTTMRKLGPEMASFKSGLTGPQFFILKLLAMKNSCTVTQLAEEMRVKPSAITTMIDRLDRHGYVTRKREENDRRVVTIHLTDSGMQALTSAQQHRKELMSKYLRQLEPEELASFVCIMEKLSQIIAKSSS